MSGEKRLLLVDDDKIHRTIYSSIATKMNFKVAVADTVAAAEAALREGPYEIMILDLMLGEHEGSDVLARIGALAVKPKVLLVTGASDGLIEQTFRTGRAFGLQLFGPVRKPVNVMHIRSMLAEMEAEQLTPEPA
jgi:DNA-binding NtrC family response regulator